MQTDLATLRKIVRQGEGLNVEFKLKTNHPEKIVREVVAFANTEGGVLIIGVSDNRQIIGAKFPEEDEYILKKAIAEYCSPEISYQIERLPLDEDSEREVLLFHIPKSENLPHQIIKGEDKGKVYVRVGEQSIQASKEMRNYLKERKKNKNYRFHYGEKEHKLMQYLASHSIITVKQFSKIAGISAKTASRTLVLLSLAKVLKISAKECEDEFSLSDDFEKITQKSTTLAS